MARTITEKERMNKRLAIIKAAGKLFSKKGYDTVTVDDIAKTLKISKVSVYNYIDSKQEILFEIHRIATEASLESIKKTQLENLSPTQKLAIIITNHIRVVCSEMSFTTATLQQEYALPRAKKKKLILR